MAGGLSIIDGLLTWGAPSAATVDPAFSEGAAPTLTGGTIGRALTRRGIGRWLLDLDLGGQIWRLGSQEVRVTSRVRGGPVSYLAGLDDLSWEIDGDSISITARAASADAWGSARRHLGPLRGRRAVLRYWYPGQDLEDAYVALQGTIGGASYADPADPYGMQFELTRDLRGLSREVLSPSAKLSYATFAGLLGDVPEEGIYYPLVIGCPGSPRSVGGLPSPATPALPINYTLTRRVLIAGHRVAASRVWLFNLTEREVVDLPVVHGTDDLGQEFAYVSLDGVPIFTFDSEHEYAVGWDREWGGGLVHRGRQVAGLGDLLQWGADTNSLVLYDQGEMAARRTALNRFRVDTLINEQILWSDWLESNVLSFFELEEVQGPRGIYYEEIRHEAHRSLVRAKLTTAADQPGYRVSRISGVVEEEEEILNRIRISYLPYAASYTQYVELVIAAPPHSTGLDATSLLLPSPRSALSERLYGPREGTWETGISSDPATIAAVARTKVAKHALPKRSATYEGGRELLDLRKQQVVDVYDLSHGATFENELAIVRMLQIVNGTTVRVTISFDTDPVTSPTVSG